MFSIEPISAFRDNYIWMLINTQQTTALVVDPGEAQLVLNTLNERALTLKGILLTHHHHDHVGGVVEIMKHHQAPVIAPFNSPFSSATKRVKAGDLLSFTQDFPEFEIMAIPGHTLDHIAYYAKPYLFCGDTLFAAGCGRLFEGTAEQLFNSLQKIAALPDDTQIYCAHEYTLNNLRFAAQVDANNIHVQQRLAKVEQQRLENLITLPSLLKEEKLSNPFLRCEHPEVIQRVEHYAKQTLDDPLAVFRELRRWKDHF